MLTRISEEKIIKLLREMDYCGPFNSNSVEVVDAGKFIQAQLEADQEKVQEIFEEIENSTVLKASIRDDMLEQKQKDWQALKEKWGVK